MSSIDKNLSEVTLKVLSDPDSISIGLVRSIWNEEITNELFNGAIDVLKSAGLPESNIHVADVPGSFELPMGAKILIGKHNLDAVICLGCVIKGETDHDKFINQAVANGLMQLGLLSGIPCIFGLLTVNDHQQALDRAGGQHGNKGEEAAATAINMIALIKSKNNKSQIGF